MGKIFIFYFNRKHLKHAESSLYTGKFYCNKFSLTIIVISLSQLKQLFINKRDYIMLNRNI